MGEDALIAALRRFNPDSQRVIREAERLARRTGQGFLGVEHLLHVLLQTLPRQRLPSESLRAFDGTLQPLLQARFSLRSQGDQTFVSDRVYSLFTTHALTVARQRRHAQVEPEDLLIAILREGQSLPVLQAQAQGVDVDELLNGLERVTRLALEIPRALRGWCDDLTARAEQGQLPPMVEGRRERELIEQALRILISADLEMGPATPVLIGEAGVGKSALADLLARKIALAEGEIPQQLQGARLIQVDMSGMLEGAVYRGMFEQRLRQTIEFAKEHRDRVILFIDELHTIVGAGRAVGTPMGADQIMLGPLGRGEIRLIGATTITQYREQIEQDEALERRFRAIPVEEPSWEVTRAILEGLRPKLEERSGIPVSPDAIEKAMELSRFYLRSRRLPGKPIQWLKEAISLVAYQGEREVTPEDIVAVVSEQTGIPPEIIFRNAQDRLWRMEEVLRARVKGQDHVISQIARRIRLNLGPLREDLNRPVGVFLFLGPSGVGKTETAKALAEFLFGDEDRMIRLDMSEYAGEVMLQELIGPPPGIVGSRRGGKLTNAVRGRPYSLVLLDEFEKAHLVIRNLFLQVFDEGWLTDGRGRKVSFSDALIIATSNLASETYRRLQRQLGFGLMRDEEFDPEQVRKAIEWALVEEGLLPPELQNRFDLICVFDPLSPDVLVQISRKLLDDLDERVRGWGKRLLYDNGVVEFLAREGFNPLLNARELQRLFAESVLEELAPLMDRGKTFRLRLEEGGAASRIAVDIEREVQHPAYEPVEEG